MDDNDDEVRVGDKGFWKLKGWAEMKPFKDIVQRGWDFVASFGEAAPKFTIYRF